MADKTSREKLLGIFEFDTSVPVPKWVRYCFQEYKKTL